MNDQHIDGANLYNTVMDLRKFRSAPEVIKTVCCVCHKVLKDGPEEPLSHGYCSDCMRATLAEEGVPQEDIDAAMKELNLARWGRIYGKR